MLPQTLDILQHRLELRGRRGLLGRNACHRFAEAAMVDESQPETAPQARRKGARIVDRAADH